MLALRITGHARERERTRVNGGRCGRQKTFLADPRRAKCIGLPHPCKCSDVITGTNTQ